jgi:hypothetical protein
MIVGLYNLKSNSELINATLEEVEVDLSVNHSRV